MSRVGPGNVFGVENVANLRDVAGVETLIVAGGQRLKRGVLFRSSLLSEGTSDDQDFITKELGCKTYIDLRTPGNPPDSLDSDIYAHFSPSPLRSGRHQDQRQDGEPRRVSCPIGKGFGPSEKGGSIDIQIKDANGGNIPMPRMTAEQHTEFLSRYNVGAMTMNKTALALCMKTLCNPTNYPVLFGCLTGKDRTGLVSALVLSVCGATRDQIMKDYMLSDLATQDNGRIMRETFTKARALVVSGNAPADMNVDALPKPGLDPAAPNAGSSASADSLQFQQDDDVPNETSIGMHVWPAVMRNTLNYLEREHGGPIQYLLSIGITAEDQGRLREILLEDAAEEDNRSRL